MLRRFKKSYNSVCRVCLSDIDEFANTSQSLFKLDEQHSLISEKLSFLTGVSVQEDDFLPQFLCENCYNSLVLLYKFRVACTSIDRELRANMGYFKKNNIFFNYNSPSIQKTIKTESININIKPNNVYADLDDEIRSMYSYGDPKVEIAAPAAANLNSPNDNNAVISINQITKEEEQKTLGVEEPKAPGVEEPKALGVAEDDHADNNANALKSELYICEICGNIYKKKYQLRRHIQFHSNLKPFECEICRKKFRQNNHLARHMRSHTGQKPHSCRYCHRCFSDLSTKIKHERSHTDERPFKCQTCGKAFRVADTRNKHMTVHTGEKAFGCELCGSRFSRKDHLRTHLKSLLHQGKLNEAATQAQVEAADVVDDAAEIPV